MPGASRGQKRASDTLKLDLQPVVGYLKVMRIKARTPATGTTLQIQHFHLLLSSHIAMYTYNLHTYDFIIFLVLICT